MRSILLAQDSEKWCREHIWNKENTENEVVLPILEMERLL